jgi:hypothetical protein
MNPLSCRGFIVWAFCCCLLQGDQDGCAEEVEGLPLSATGEVIFSIGWSPITMVWRVRVAR